MATACHACGTEQTIAVPGYVLVQAWYNLTLSRAARRHGIDVGICLGPFDRSLI